MIILLPMKFGESNPFLSVTQEQEVKKPLIRNHLYNHSGPMLVHQQIHSGSPSHRVTAADVNGHMATGTGRMAACHGSNDSCLTMFLHCLKGNTKYKSMRSVHRAGPVSVSKIDSMSRIIFPFVFTCLNILYWAGFLYYF